MSSEHEIVTNIEILLAEGNQIDQKFSSGDTVTGEVVIATNYSDLKPEQVPITLEIKEDHPRYLSLVPILVHSTTLSPRQFSEVAKLQDEKEWTYRMLFSFLLPSIGIDRDLRYVIDVSVQLSDQKPRGKSYTILLKETPEHQEIVRARNNKTINVHTPRGERLLLGLDLRVEVSKLFNGNVTGGRKRLAAVLIVSGWTPGAQIFIQKVQAKFIPSTNLNDDRAQLLERTWNPRIRQSEITSAWVGDERVFDLTLAYMLMLRTDDWQYVDGGEGPVLFLFKVVVLIDKREEELETVLELTRTQGE